MRMVAHTARLSQMVSVRGETEFERFWRLLAIFAAFEATLQNADLDVGTKFFLFIQTIIKNAISDGCSTVVL